MFSFLQPKQAGNELTGISITDSGISAVSIIRGPERRSTEQVGVTQEHPPAITACQFYPIETGTSPQALLNKCCADMKLRKNRCTTVLNNDSYKLLLTDRPEVAENELLSAVRWNIKDILDTPIEQTTFDLIKAPPPADTSAAGAVYVVAASNETIQQQVDLFHEAKINLRTIDITEMALRNIAALLPEVQQGAAILWLHDEGGIILIQQDNDIFVCRNLNIGLNDLQNDGAMSSSSDNLMLELQRSLDYYTTRFRRNPIRSISLAPSLAPYTWLHEMLRNTVGLEVNIIDLSTVLSCSVDMPDDWQSRFFLAIGSALRQDGVAAS